MIKLSLPIFNSFLTIKSWTYWLLHYIDCIYLRLWCRWTAPRWRRPEWCELSALMKEHETQRLVHVRLIFNAALIEAEEWATDAELRAQCWVFSVLMACCQELRRWGCTRCDWDVVLLSDSGKQLWQQLWRTLCFLMTIHTCRLAADKHTHTWKD